MTNLTSTTASAGLSVLPEFPRMFQWKGLPFFMVCSNQNEFPGWIHVGHPGANAIAPSNKTRFIVRQGQTLDEVLKNDEPFRQMREEAQQWYEKDYIYRVTFFHKNWCEGTWDDSFIRRAVEATWDIPNVQYAYMYEWYSEGKRPLHLDWVKRFREIGRQHNPDVNHLFFSLQSEMNASPEDLGVDFYLGEAAPDRQQWGFPTLPDSSHPCFKFNAPLVRDAVQQCLYRNTSIKRCLYEGVVPASFESSTGKLMRQQVALGIHSGEPYGPIDDTYKNHLLQLRWYMENLKSWSNEPGDEICESKLPVYQVPQRAKIQHAEGYLNGCRMNGSKLEFGAIYVDPLGKAPLQAEVWVDRDGDGKYRPEMNSGDRLLMKAESAPSCDGVLYKASLDLVNSSFGNKPVRYIFRFTDSRHYPPLPGGVIKGHFWGGYSYDSWMVE